MIQPTTILDQLYPVRGHFPNAAGVIDDPMYNLSLAHCETPWGPARVIEPTRVKGIWRIETDTLNGYLVAMPQADWIRRSFPSHRPFKDGIRYGNGNQVWYGDDADWAALAMNYPHAFSSEKMAAAAKILNSMREYFYGAPKQAERFEVD
jgi:hypothetical protein